MDFISLAHNRSHHFFCGGFARAACDGDGNGVNFFFVIKSKFEVCNQSIFYIKNKLGFWKDKCFVRGKIAAHTFIDRIFNKIMTVEFFAF